MKLKYCLFIMLALSLGLSRQAFAHKLILELEQLGNGKTLAIGYFPDGTPSINTPVDIYEGDRKILTGQTNENGEWIFSPPAGVSQIKGILRGEMGHRTESDILVLGKGTIIKNKSPQAADRHNGHGHDHPHEGHEEHTHPEQKSPAAKPRRIRKEKFPLNNVLAGLGFIFGLASLVLHFTKKS